MTTTFAGYEAIEEVRTEALVVVYRAHKSGGGDNGDLYWLRAMRNPGQIIDDQRWKAVVGGRLASLNAQRRASDLGNGLITPVLEAGEADGRIFDVTPACPMTLADVVLQRIALDGRELHSIFSALIKAIQAFREASGRAHGAVCAETVRVESAPLAWDVEISLDVSAAPSVAGESERTDLLALGRLLYALSAFEPAGVNASRIAGDLGAFRAAGRRAIGWRRLCADLLNGAPEAATLEQVEKRIEALRLPTPAQSRRNRILVSTVAVLALGAGAMFGIPRKQPALFETPEKEFFTDLKNVAERWRHALQTGDAGSQTVASLAEDGLLAQPLAILSLDALEQSGQLRRWSGASMRRFTQPGADQFNLIDWTKPAVGEWWEAEKTLREGLLSELVDPLDTLATRAEERGWNDAARSAREAAAACRTAIESLEMGALFEQVQDAGVRYDQVLAWLTQIEQIDATVAQSISQIGQTQARATSPSGEEVGIVDALNRWTSAARQAVEGETPEETIRRYRNVTSVVIESVADAARYWDSTAEFEVDEFLDESSPLRPDDLADAAAGRQALLAWAGEVQLPQFLNIGADPRPALFARRDALVQEVEARVASLSETDRNLIEERLAAFRAQIGQVSDVFGAQLDSAWNVANEQPIRQAVANSDSQLATANDQWSDIQNFLEERANIELRRTNVIARAETLAQAQGGWLASDLQPLIDAARAAGPSEVESAVDALSTQRQRLQDVSRIRDALEGTLATVSNDPRLAGDALRARGIQLLESWMDAARAGTAEAAAAQASIEEIGRLSGEMADLAQAIDSRTMPSASPGLLDRVQVFLDALRSAGVDVNAAAGNGRLLAVLTQLEPYIAVAGQWGPLQSQLADDMAAESLRSESLWYAYAMARDSEASSNASLSIEDIELERDVRARLEAAFDALPVALAQPATLDRVDQWMSARPSVWTDGAAAAADIRRAMSLLAPSESPDAATHPSLGAGELLLAMLDYRGPVDDEAAVTAQISSYQQSLATLRQSTDGASDWYPLLERLNGGVDAVLSGESGPALTEELLQTAGPGSRGWTLRPGGVVERPVYERGGQTLSFVLDDSQDPPVFVGLREVSLSIAEQILGQASGDEWNVFSAHAPVKDWGVSPDYAQMSGTIRGYFFDDQRRVTLQEDWYAPAATHIEGGNVAWQAHFQQIYGADASKVEQWAPSMASPLHHVGFQAALAIARAAGCRLPSPEEWVAALNAVGSADLAAANISDAAWSRQWQRASREVPEPWSGSYLPFGRTDTPAPFDTADDGWLWLRPVPEDAQSQIADMIGNAAEWADIRANERSGDEPLEMEAAQVRSEAMIMGISAMSGAGSPDQRVTVGNRFDRSSMATGRDAGRMGFSDVGVRLFFDVGAVRPKSLAERFTLAIEDTVAGVDVSGG